MKMVTAAIVAVLLVSNVALAETPRAPDPRLTAPQIAVLESLVRLREAELHATVEDAAKREADWAEYAAPLWRTVPAKGSAKPR